MEKKRDLDTTKKQKYKTCIVSKIYEKLIYTNKLKYNIKKKLIKLKRDTYQRLKYLKKKEMRQKMEEPNKDKMKLNICIIKLRK